MGLEKFCGEVINDEQIGELTEIIKTFPKLSRSELANTICELFSWKRPNGKLKSVECRSFLEELDKKGIICAGTNAQIRQWQSLRELPKRVLNLPFALR
jgi:hypothetical protein